jgi:hypothetical protein
VGVLTEVPGGRMRRMLLARSVTAALTATLSIPATFA